LKLCHTRTVSDAGEPKPRVIDPATAPTKELRYGRGSVIRLVDADIGARDVDLHLNTVNPGTAPGPYHLHRQVENVYYVLEGTGCIRIDGVDHTVTQGQAVFIPRGVPHSAHNPGDGPLRLLEIYAPVDVDFVEVPDPSAQPTTAAPPDPSTQGS
jgi:mannose-6-phosphate isomerase-like protein (cupin superfamily)